MHAFPRHRRPTESAPRPRLRIGVVIDEMDGEYHRPLIDGLCREAALAGVDLVFFPGHLPGTPQPFEQQFGMAFRMVDAREFDGLLIFGTLMQGHLDEDGMRRFIAGFGGLPAVVMGVEETGHCTLMLDNRGGIRKLMRHLIDVHGHRRIAMIEGPTGNRDAQERLAAYLEVLAESSLDVDPALRVPGLFHVASGREGMGELLRRGVPFTALVCANDEMAKGALSVAVEHGLRVPEDIAIGGFDDLLSIYHVGPSLTSVNHAIDTQGQAALRLLCGQLRGEPVPAQTALPSRLVVRRSCGCMGPLVADRQTAGGLPEQAEELVRQMDPPEALVAEFTRDVLALANALFDADGGPAFAQILTRMAFAWLRQQSDISPLQNLLVGMHRRWLGYLHAGNVGRAAERLQSGQILLANVTDQFHNREQVASFNNTWTLRRELKKRMAAVDIDALLEVLSDGLLRLGVPTCLLALYDRPTTLQRVQDEGVPPTSRLVLALDDGVLRNELLGEDFPTTQILPASLAAAPVPRCRVIFPMFYLQEHFGYMVLERQSDERFSYEDLHHEIATALHTCLVVKELGAARDALRLDLDRARRDNEALSHLAMRDELTGLFNRRGFFELAHSMMSTARLTGQPLTLFFADLDGLKTINDTHGHQEGDDAIRSSAGVLHATFRQDDIVSRIGGDEFAVLSRADNLESLPEIERRLNARFDDFNAASGKPYRIGCSLGGIVIAADSVEPLDQVLAQADRLLYFTKRRRKAQAASA